MKKKLNIAILTISDTRNTKTDKSGELLKKKVLKSHHNLSVKEICKDNKIHKLFYASSSSIYGSNTILPFNENQKTENPAKKVN